MKLFSKIISVALHPLFVVLYAFSIVLFMSGYHANLPDQIKHLVMLIVFFNTVVVPLVVLLIFKQIGIIGDMKFNSSHDRIISIVIVVMSYVFTLIVSHRLGLPAVFTRILVGAGFAMCIAAIITYWWRISYHAMGAGGLTAFIVMIAYLQIIPYILPIVMVLLLSGLLLSARLKLGAHSPMQVYAGYLAGAVIIATVLIL